MNIYEEYLEFDTERNSTKQLLVQEGIKVRQQ
jgi:hypothetical protein